MKKYRYRALSFNPESTVDIVKKLNELGKEEWDLVSVLELKNGHREFYLKKEIFN